MRSIGWSRWILGCLISLLWLSASGMAVADSLPLSGQLLDAKGSPVVGARISVAPMRSKLTRALESLDGVRPEEAALGLSGNDGRFSIAVPAAGLWTVTIEADGYLPIEQSLLPMIDGREFGEIRLAAATPFTVRIVDTAGGPLPGATVLLRKDGGRRFAFGGNGWKQAPRIGMSSADGTIRFERGERERVTVSAHGVGHMPTERRGMLGSGVTLALDSIPASTLRITEPGGEPAAGVIVTEKNRTLPLGRSDAEGRVEFSLPIDGLSLELHAADRLRWSGTLSAPRAPADGATAAELSVQLNETRTMVGRVIDAKSLLPIAGAVVWDETSPLINATSDDSGLFALQAVAGQRLRLLAGSTRYLRPPSFEFPLNDDGRPGPTIALDPASMLTGRVLDADGEPISGADVALEIQHSGNMIRISRGGFLLIPNAVTDEKGQFVIHSIDPEQSYRLKASAEGYATAERKAPQLHPHQVAADVDLTLERGRAIIGSVVDEAGQPVGEVQISVSEASEGGPMGGLSMSLGGDSQPTVSSSDSDGLFRVAGLAEGSVNLSASRSGFATKKLEGLKLDTEDLELEPLVLSPGETVEGHVFDSDGLPIEAAELVISESSPMAAMMVGLSGGDRGEPTTISDPNGWFAANDLAPQTKYSISAGRPGFVTSQLDGVTLPLDEPLTFKLQPASRIIGVVVDDSGEPIVGAKVDLLRTRTMETGGMALQVAFNIDSSTDAEGRFLFEDQEPGKVTLSAVASGYQEAKLADVEIPKGEDLTDLSIELTDGAIVEGRVLAPDGRAAIGATVSKVAASGGFGPRMSGMVSVDGDGYFRLEGLAPGAVSIEAKHDDYPRVARDVELTTGINALNMEFEGGQEISGTVTDRDGNAVLGASVRAVAPGRYWSEGGASTDSNGDFVLSGVQDGEYALRVAAEGYAESDEEPVTVTGQPLSGLQIVLERGATIVGTVSGVDAEDLSRVSVRTEGSGFDFAGAGVDREGRFRLQNRRAGEHKVVATMADSARQASAQVTVDPGVVEVPVDLVFDSGVTLSGRLHQADRGIAGATIAASHKDESRVGWSQTDANGNFSIDGLTPGRYSVSAREFRSGISVTETIELSTSREIELEVPSNAIRGQVIDESDRNSLAGVRLILSGVGQESAGMLPAHSATTDSEGQFTLPAVSDGNWKLTAEKQGYATLERQITVQQGRDVDGLRLKLSPTEGVSLQVSLPSGGFPQEVRVAVLSGTGAIVNGNFATGERGSVRLSTVPAGRWELLVSASGSAVTQVAVQAPGPVVPIALSPGTRLSIHVPELAASAQIGTVRIVGSNSQPFRSLGWSGQPQTSWPLRGGRIEIGSLPPGIWTVSVDTYDGARWGGTITTSPTATASLTLDGNGR